MIHEIGEVLIAVLLVVFGLALALVLVGLMTLFVVGFFAIPVWIVCWAFDLAFSWKVVLGVIAIFMFLGMISG